MMEKFEQQEPTQSLEKSPEELYLDALEKKRDTLLSFHAMNSFRKNRSPEDMAPEEIEQYKSLKEDWRLNKEKSMRVWDILPEDYQQELVAMGSRLYDVQAKLTLLKLKNKPEAETGETTTEVSQIEVKPPEKSESEEAESAERQSAEADAQKRESISGKISEIDKVLSEKY